MTLTEQDGLRILTPDEGRWLYIDENDNRIFSTLVYLAKSDKPENWHECTEAEKQAYEQEHNPQEQE